MPHLYGLFTAHFADSVQSLYAIVFTRLVLSSLAVNVPVLARRHLYLSMYFSLYSCSRFLWLNGLGQPCYG